MGELICSHCGKEVAHYEAANAEAKGDTCPENTDVIRVDGYKGTRELQHNWVNPDSWDNTDLSGINSVPPRRNY